MVWTIPKETEKETGFEKIRLQNRECLICDTDIDYSNPKSYLTFEGDYCKKSPIVLLNGKRFKHFLIYGNVCVGCFKEINKTPEGVKRFKDKFDKQLNKFKDRL